MIRQTGKVIDGPWTETPKILLDEFCKLAEKHRVNVLSMQDSILYVYELFNEEEEIWPDQCDYAINSLQTLSEPIFSFSALLDASAQLPEDIYPLRYPLAMALHKAVDLANDLTQIIKVYRGVSQSSTRQVILLRREILLNLEKLIQGTEDILHNVDILLDQVRFHERR